VRVRGLLEGDPRRIPASHLDLVECPPVAALTTLMPDGYPQTSVVWCDFDGANVRINTMRGFQKERNMRRNPRVTLLCYDPRRPLRYLEVRGTVVEMTEEDAARHLDELASKYAGRPIRYFGDHPCPLRGAGIPTLCLIRPTRVVALDATTETADDAPRRVGHGRDPASHVDLLARPICGVLTTILPSGQPQSSLVRHADARHLPDPRPADQPRRDPRLTRRPVGSPRRVRRRQVSLPPPPPARPRTGRGSRP
jgi:PPOX class probable F420-dependent enzyme